jgi:general secretion pathway protein E
MSAVLPPLPPLNSNAHQPHAGPLDWRTLVEWLSEDGVISAPDAQRTIARCAQVQSAQHPMVRLASIGMTRVLDGKPSATRCCRCRSCPTNW